MARRDDSDDELENPNEKYHESSDEDFNPESAPAEDASSSEDEDDAPAAKPAQRKGKRKVPLDEELDSGDELTIQAARKKRAKKKKGAKNDEDDDDLVLLSDDDGGEGGLIKTRAQRQVERKERKPLARTEGATVDVDALWAQMTAAPLKPAQPVALQEQQTQSIRPSHDVAASAPTEEEEQVVIKKVYTFAGQDTTEEKQIPRSQLNAHLASGWKTLTTPEKSTEAEAEAEAATTTTPDTTPRSTIRRPLRRPTRYDPNPSGFVRALAPEHQLSWPRKTGPILFQTPQENMPAPDLSLKPKPEKAHKLNVVDKSRMDWTGFVDKEGIAEELDTHGKTKEAYLGRMDFLAGVDARREEERRNLKIKAAAATGS